LVDTVLFVHAHPDDESISTGGTIATLIDRGDRVIVLTCTRGERGEVIPAELRHLEATSALAAHREGELAAALTELGVTEHRFLGAPEARWQGRPPRRYRDSGMRWGKNGAETADSLDPESLTSADPGEVAADIAAALIKLEPDVVVSYAADGGYGHPDHKAAHRATRTAAEVVGVPFYVIETGAKAQLSVDVAAVLDRKRGAIAAYPSQMTVTGDTFVTPAGTTEAITSVERFSRLRPTGTGFADHSLASRLVACVLAVVLGAFAGATLTVTHQASVGALPWGIVAAIIITTALLVGLRMVFETRIVPALAAVGLLGISALLAAQSTGGSVLVPANVAGYTWTFAPVVIALVVLAWPRITPPVGGKIGTVPAAKGPDLP